MEKDVKRRELTSAIEVPIVEEAVVVDEVEHSRLDEKGRAAATGRRKTSSARVWISSGDTMTVNGKDLNKYFPTDSLQRYVFEPVAAVGLDKIKVYATVCGGGLVGQAGALRHGIARALVNLDPTFRVILRAGDYLTRDSRKKEREKPGFRTSRKSQQFSKR